MSPAAGPHGPSQDETIRTPDQRIRVFISSTLGELAAERIEVRSAIEALHLTPVLFEGGARPHPPRELYRAYLRQSHVFIGLYFERYGWVAPGEQISGLEDEYRLSGGLPRLIYIKNPTGGVEPRLRDLLADIRDEGGTSYRRFDEPGQLSGMVAEDLAALLSEQFLLRTPEAEPVDAHLPPPPVPLTPTVGRAADIAAVLRLLDDRARLLTVTGVGGVGKSRLALEVARGAASRFPDGVVLVRLEAVDDADMVLRSMASALHVHDTTNRPVLEVLVEAIGQRRLLLIVDNMEQVAAAGPDLAALLGRCPGLTALVTSRQALRVRGEREYHLDPLPVPAETGDRPLSEVPSVDLFVQRATAVAPSFRLTAANSAAVAELVGVLDGLPLAIELAAGHSRLLTPAALLRRLAHALDALDAGAADLPPRQRTQRATIDWSYDLLTPPEQALFTRMSVFAGGASLEAIVGVCTDDEVPGAIETVSSLVEKSLLTASIDDDGAEPRIRMLQTVRTRAAELLAARHAEDVWRARHTRWFAELAEPGDVLRHARAPLFWPSLESEAANLWQAAQRAADVTDDEALVTLVRRCWSWLWMSGRAGDLRDLVLHALAASPADRPAEVTGYLSYVAGLMLTLTGDFTAALHRTETALQTYGRCSGDDIPLLVAHARLVRGTLLMTLDREGGVGADLDEAVRVGRATDNAWLLAYATSHRGMGLALRGRTDLARADHEEALALASAMGHDVLVAQQIGQLAIVDVLEGRLNDGTARLRRQVRHLRDTSNLEGLANALDATAALAGARQRWEVAARAAGAAESLRSRIEMAAWPPMRRHHAAAVAAAGERLGDRLESVMTEGRSADPWSTIDGALLALALDEPAAH